MNMGLSSKDLYKAFAAFPKPEHSTNHQHCPECAEYDELLMHVPREALSIEDIGTVCWGPVAFLTPDAMAYYLPRLMELALSGVKNKDGEPFFKQFLNQIGLHASSDARFARLETHHKELVRSCLEALGRRFKTEIEEECCDDWLAESIANWRI